ncbi:hypothetical protein D3C87_1433080 [compost metagenome]
MLVAFDHQGFQHQFPALDQAILQRQQMLDGRTAVVEHTHGKYRVEPFEVRRQVFEREGQVPGVRLGQVALHRLELAEEQPVRVDTDHAVRAGAEHAPHVITVAAADIEDALAFQVQVRGDPRPLPVRAPFGIDVHAEQVERPLAPWRQSHQRSAHLRAGLVAAISIQLQAIEQIDFARLDLRQGVQRALPAFQVAMALFHFLVELRLQGVGPIGQRRAGQTAGEGRQINHGKAINEAKLRHWNHGTTFENPAANRRSRCSSRLSGFMTFSMALRFWAISSSL